MKWEVLVMKSKASFYNAGLIKQDFKQHGWIGLVYLIGLLFFFPLKLMMIFSNPKHHLYYSKDLTTLAYLDREISLLFVTVISVGTAVMLFRYLQVKESVDTLHSLPIKRKQHFASHIFSGVIMLWVPVILTGLLTLVVYQFAPAGQVLSTVNLIHWMAIMLLMSTFFYIFTVLVGMITGQSVMQGALTFIFLILPAALLTLITEHLRFYLYGFLTHYINQNLERWSPFIKFIEFNFERSYSVTEVIVYLALIALFSYLALWLYNRRHLESATDPIVFSILKPILKYGFAFCVMLISGLYFSSSQNDQMSWMYFGYVVGGLLGYVIAEMILQKSWRIFEFKLVKEIGVYFAIFTVLIISLHLDIFGFESRIPAADQIKGVYFGNDFYYLQENEQKGKNLYESDKGYIDNILKLHTKIAEEQPTNESNDHYREMTHAFISYQLKNGKQFVRHYSVPTKEIETELKPIVETETYKNEHFRLHQLDQTIEKITFYSPEHLQGKQVVIADPNEINEVKELLKKDIYSLSYEEIMNPNTNTLVEMEFLASDTNEYNQYRGFHYTASKNYSRVKNWLEEKGHLSKLTISVEDISHIEVASIKIENQVIENPYEHTTVYPEAVFGGHHYPENFNFTTEKVVKIEKNDEIEEALLTYRKGIVEANMYAVKFVTNTRQEFYGVFVPEELPSFITTYFK